MNRPSMLGLRHVALFVPRAHFSATVDFYTHVIGLKVDWHPDAENIYLSSGSDNLALHCVNEEAGTAGNRLDHLGFALERAEEVDAWHAFLGEQGIEELGEVHTHRDGACSFYCRAPDGVRLQFIHHVGMLSAD